MIISKITDGKFNYIVTFKGRAFWFETKDDAHKFMRKQEDKFMLGGGC